MVLCPFLFVKGGKGIENSKNGLAGFSFPDFLCAQLQGKDVCLLLASLWEDTRI